MVATVNFGQDAGVETIVLFTFDSQLRLRSVTPSDTFEMACLELARTGKIAPLRPGEAVVGMQSVLRWSGRAMVDMRAQANPDRIGP